MMKYIQEHIKTGVKFPYKPDEFLTDFKFKEGSMHIMLDVEQKMADLLERDFWWDKLGP